MSFGPLLTPTVMMIESEAEQLESQSGLELPGEVA